VSPLLDDDGYAEGRTSNSGNSRCSSAEACGRLEVMTVAKAGVVVNK